MIPLALTRNDIASYVDKVFLVFLIIIFARILLSWVYTLRGSVPYNPTLRAVTDFIHQTTDPYLNIFRRVLPPVGVGGMGLDLSPMLGVIVLFIVQAVVVAAIAT